MTRRKSDSRVHLERALDVGDDDDADDSLCVTCGP